ncbi:murein DD-endopeptidase MepM/ murein hydrolase activator NlpD [Geodermatophilus bullaregiensis]|uniref:M23 family metallopeptidase n=1 Tax=Geodermatophilus bullaregiensis TaxID=1564160 RepID=UPI0027DD2535|nr:M23 family metallopeptidase [Geodermatophilus bullaregiensis]MBM7805469.1 murein DD-endopeptidase MepM/ murein hydrolase activator NlpD [Geodermatophilus bullaregiensis]
MCPSPAVGAVHSPAASSSRGRVDGEAPGVPVLVPARPLVAALLTVAAVLGPAPAVAEPPSPVAGTAAWTSPLGDPPAVTRPFQPPASPYGPGHRGADLAGAPGTVVRAAGDGVVAFAGMVAGRPVVSVDHADGLRTTYEPVAPVVAAGQGVARGSPLGTVLAGHEGCPAAACLHWGLRRAETYLDPLALLRPPEVRLLPLG